MEGYIERLGFPRLARLDLEAVLGADGNSPPKLALTLRTELANRLMSRGGQVYCPVGIAKASVKTVLMVETVNEVQKARLVAAINE